MLTRILVFSIFLNLSTCQIDPCKVYKTFPSAEKRLPTNAVDSNSVLSDRYIREGWYGEYGIEISHVNPGFNKCGTRRPIYLKDQITDTSPNILTVDLCFLYSANHLSCPSPLSIETKYCRDQLRVYKLKKLPFSDGAYCAGPIGTGAFPDYTAKADVTVDLDTDGYVFTCNFDQFGAQILHYTVYWYINDVFIYKFPTLQGSANLQTQTQLTETLLKSTGTLKVGFQIKCSFRVSYGVASTQGLHSYSSNEFIGIEILTPTINMEINDVKEIKLRPTAPIKCNIPDCTLEVNVYNFNTHTCQPLNTHKSCGLELPAGNQWNQVSSLDVSASPSLAYGNSITLNIIRLKTVEWFWDHDMWQNYNIGEVHVRIHQNTTEIQGKQCYAVCDPHMRTFNGYRYEHQYLGIFTLFRNKALDQEIQIQTAPCGFGIPGATCICGMIIRSGRQAYKFDHCGIGAWYIGHVLCDDVKDLFRVKVSGENSYKITFSSSTYLTVSLWNGFINVYVHPSILDIGEADGLCGSFPAVTQFRYRDNRTPVSIYETGFSESWRVPDNENLFTPAILNGVSRSGVQVFPCNCQQDVSHIVNSIECKVDENQQNCATLQDFRDIRQCQLGSRTKRSTHNPFGYVHKIEKRSSQANTGWRNGWTEVKARDFCQKKLNDSKAVQLCTKVPNIDTTGSLESCVLDIKLMGDTSFSMVAVESVTTKCFHELEANLALQQPNENSNEISLFEMVKNVACRNECSERGICRKGKCICEENYGGADCSVDISVPPVIESVSHNGTCDTSIHTCTEILIFGGIFVRGQKSVCKIRSTVALPYQDTREFRRIHNIGEFDTLTDLQHQGETVCVLPSKRRAPDSGPGPGPQEGLVYIYKVSLTNNGEAYSDEFPFVVFNSVCQQCNISGSEVTCSFKEGYCISGTDCYRPGESLKGNDCLICSVRNQRGYWIDRKGVNPP